MKKNNKLLYFIVFVLIVAFCACVFVHFTLFTKDKSDVDVIDIIDDCTGDDCDNDKPSKDEDKPSDGGNGGSSSSGDGSGYGPGEGDFLNDTELVVRDDVHVWTKNTVLNVFNVPEIAPSSTGSYEFMLRNNTPKNSKYYMDFSEDNEYHVNLLYKLKRNDQYIAGSEAEWVYIDRLDIDGKVLNSDYNDYYTLEWRWVDASNDTAVGMVKGATYRLNLNIKAFETAEIDTTANRNPNTGDDVIFYVELGLLCSIILVLLIIKKRQKD